MINPALEALLLQDFHIRTKLTAIVELHTETYTWQHFCLRTLHKMPPLIGQSDYLNSMFGVPVVLNKTIEDGIWELRTGNLVLAKGPFELEPA